MNDRNSNEEYRTLSFANLVVKNRLGRGATSHVLKTQSIRTKKCYAMKVIDKFSNDYKPAALLRQIQVHKKLKFVHICQFIKHFEDQSNHYIVSQYCKDGQLTNFLSRPINEAKILTIAHQVGQALNYMHNEAGFSHGDLKLSNILINGPNLKLCDFGFSMDLSSDNQKQQPTNGPFGTLMYMAPEILKNNCNKYYKEGDIWAFGICLLTLMLKNKPYTAQSENVLRKQIKNAEYIKPTKHMLPHFSQQLLELVRKMLESDHRYRIKIEQIINHKLFAKFRRMNREKSSLNLSNIPQNIGYETQSQIQYKKSRKVSINESQINSTAQKESEEANKSAFNITVDTLTEIQQNTSIPSCIVRSQSNISSNFKNWLYCLKPQFQKTGQDGWIQIMKDHSAKIKIKKVQYIISSEGGSLTIVSGMKNGGKFCLKQIENNDKIHSLYKYGLQLIGILKKKQIILEEVINGKYFWATKKAIKCFINSQVTFERHFGQKQIFHWKNGSEEQKKEILEKDLRFEAELKIFEQGQKYLLSKLCLNNK